MITLLVIIFIVSMIVLRIKSTPEEERDHLERYLGKDVADKEYYKMLAKEQIKEEDKEELKLSINKYKLSFQQGKTKKERIQKRIAELIKEENNK